MQNETSLAGRSYRPELISRRGEWTAWILTLAVAGAWLVVVIAGKAVIWAVPIMELLLGLSATSISLGNWMDRHTVLRLDERGVGFKNGLRDVYLKWNEIREVRVQPAQWGKKVDVLAEESHFGFRTLGEVQSQGRAVGRVGFARGDEILREIILNSELQISEQTREMYVYVRK